MKTMSAGIENKIDALLACLEKDSHHIEQNLSRLNELRRLVIKHDDSALGILLESIRVETESYRNHELSRQSQLQELADVFGCNPEQMTLSKLEACLPEAQKTQITLMKSKLRSLIEELKKEYFSTVLLVSECARFNNLLLKSIFDLGKTGVVYYNSKGTTRQQTDTAFVNLQF